MIHIVSTISRLAVATKASSVARVKLKHVDLGWYLDG